MKIATKSAMALFAAGLLLAGCSRSSEDPPVPVENETPAVEENMTAPEETPVMTNDAETVAPVNMAADTIRRRRPSGRSISRCWTMPRPPA